MLTGVAVEREAVVGAILDTDFGFTVREGVFASVSVSVSVSDVVSAAIADTDIFINQYVDNVS